MFLSIGTLVFKIDRAFFYFLIASVYLVSITYLMWLLRRRFLRTLAIIQIIIDCILVSIIVLYTGSIDSVFTILYMVTILNASVVVSPLAGMITTALVSILYVGQLSLGVYNYIPFLTIQPFSLPFIRHHCSYSMVHCKCVSRHNASIKVKIKSIFKQELFNSSGISLIGETTRKH